MLMILMTLLNRPFQLLNPNNYAPNWVKVSEFAKHQVYQEVKRRS